MLRLHSSLSLTPTLSVFLFADYASRGQKKFGDKCENTLECGFPGSICDPKKKSCQCTEDLPVTNHIDKCGKGKFEGGSCKLSREKEAVSATLRHLARPCLSVCQVFINRNAECQQCQQIPQSLRLIMVRANCCKLKTATWQCRVGGGTGITA